MECDTVSMSAGEERETEKEAMKALLLNKLKMDKKQKER